MYTKEERQEIYQITAERIFSGNLTYCCPGLNFGPSTKREYYGKGIKLLYPEFWRFNPCRKKETDSWFSGNLHNELKESKEARIFILLLSAEMCNY